MSTTQNQDQATGTTTTTTTTSFRLTTIPFSRVAATIADRPGPGNNLHADTTTLCRTAAFNSHDHSRAELAAAFLPPPPGTADLGVYAAVLHSLFPPDVRNAEDDDEDDEDDPAFAYSTWLAPLVARSQRIPGSALRDDGGGGSGSSVTAVRLPRLFVADVLLAAHARWLRTDALPAALMNELLEDWPGVVADLEGAIDAAAAAASTTDGGPGEERGEGRRGGGGAFVRLDACSPKDSALHDATGTPVGSVGDAVRVLAGSMRAAGAMGRWVERGRRRRRQGREETTMTMRLCVVPWDERMDPGNEFRVFVPQRRRSRVEMGMEEEEGLEGGGGGDGGGLRISAISQYRWCEPLRLREAMMGVSELVRLVEEGAERLLGEILEVAGRLEGTDEKEGKGVMEVLERRGFVFDVAVMRQADASYEVQLVELNPFGAMTGCGSLLFHWLKDAKVLYGLEQKEFRVALDGQ